MLYQYYHLYVIWNFCQIFYCNIPSVMKNTSIKFRSHPLSINLQTANFQIQSFHPPTTVNHQPSLPFYPCPHSASMDVQIDCVRSWNIKHTAFCPPLLSSGQLSKIYLPVIYQLDNLFSLSTCQILTDKLVQSKVEVLRKEIFY